MIRVTKAQKVPPSDLYLAPEKATAFVCAHARVCVHAWNLVCACMRVHVRVIGLKERVCTMCLFNFWLQDCHTQACPLQSLSVLDHDHLQRPWLPCRKSFLNWHLRWSGGTQLQVLMLSCVMQCYVCGVLAPSVRCACVSEWIHAV